MTDKNIMPMNDNGNQHGYHEMYFDDGSLSFKCTYDNGTMVGYFEDHFPPETTDMAVYIIDKMYIIL